MSDTDKMTEMYEKGWKLGESIGRSKYEELSDKYLVLSVKYSELVDKYLELRDKYE